MLLRIKIQSYAKSRKLLRTCLDCNSHGLAGLRTFLRMKVIKHGQLWSNSDPGTVQEYYALTLPIDMLYSKHVDLYLMPYVKSEEDLWKLLGKESGIRMY